MASLVLTVLIHSFLVSICHLLLYFSSVGFLRRATLQCQWMQHSCIEVILNTFFFPQGEWTDLSLKGACLSCWSTTALSEMYFFPSTSDNSKWQHSAEGAGGQQAMSWGGGTACAAAGLGERKAASGAEQERRGAPLRAVAWEMCVRPVSRQLEIPAPVSIRAGGISAGQRICFHTSFPTVW